MTQEPIARLESLVDRLLDERAELMRCNQALQQEKERLQEDRSRIRGELDGILAKLERLEQGGAA